MPTTEKPYRVYRQPRRVRGDGSIAWDDASPEAASGRASITRRLLRFTRRIVFIALAAGLVWGVIAFFSFRSAVSSRNDAVPPDVRAALAPTDGPAVATSQVTLLVGSDTSKHRKTTQGKDYGLADTLMLMRVDLPSRTVSLLSIPRDLYVEVPGLDGKRKINEAYANGGLALAIRTVRRVTGVEVNHVAEVDFDGFKEIVDELGGVEIDNPTLIRSGTKFDGRNWVFPKGKQKLNGRDALAYARIRKVDDATLSLDLAEGTDLGRARRQQRVIDAIIAEVASPGSLLRPRGLPRAMVRPLLTDISATELLTFGFGKIWSTSSNNLRCRLGGDDGYDDEGLGQVLIPNEKNRAAVRMFLGRQAPVPPEDALSAGCVREGS